MVDFYKGEIPILDDAPDHMPLAHPPGVGYGAEPRDWNEFPQEMFASPSEMELVPKSEWDARYDEQEAQQSSLEHIYLSGPGGTPRFVNLDQNGDGYCWMYSKGSCFMMNRLASNQPMVRLNPHANAAILMNGANRGGWCGLGVKGPNGLHDMGMPSAEFWPGHSRSLANDTPAMRANAAKHRILEDWFDLTKQVHNQEMTDLQIATCGFNNTPTAQDFDWWGHSVCGIRWVRIEAGSWGPLILNSWLNWGRYGLAVLRGSKAKADGAIAIRATTASRT